MRLNRSTLSILFSLLVFNSQAQITRQATWQQTVNYTIEVSLDDKNHILRGFETMEYINNSPNTLEEIYIHLWPNAYKNDQTSFAKQMITLPFHPCRFVLGFRVSGLRLGFRV